LEQTVSKRFVRPKSACQLVAVLPLPMLLLLSAATPLAVLKLPVIVTFPANPRNEFCFAYEPKANRVPARLKCVVALTTPPLTASFAVTLVAVTLPFTLWFAVNVLAAPNCGTLLVSRFSVTVPLVPLHSRLRCGTFLRCTPWPCCANTFDSIYDVLE
jgi:hypothetical protein